MIKKMYNCIIILYFIIDKNWKNKLIYQMVRHTVYNNK